MSESREEAERIELATAMALRRLAHEFPVRFQQLVQEELRK